MLRACRLSRVRFPGCGRICPYPQPDAILPFPPVVRSHQRSAVVSVERCGRHTQRDVHAGLGSGGFGRFREASETRGFGNCAILLVALSAEISGLDYGWHGIVEILVFHLFRSKNTAKAQGCCNSLSHFRLCRIMVSSERCWLAP